MRLDELTSDFHIASEHLRLFAQRQAAPTASGMSNIIQAVLAAEDRRFLFHSGVDLIGIARAISRLAVGGRLEGASTIEQQLIRTLRGRYEITLDRKVTECLLAIAISRKFEKKTIMLAYLDVAYFGWKATGLEAAASRLGVSISNASKTEAAAIAAMLKVPMPRAPSAEYRVRHAKRVKYILSNLEKVKERDDQII